MSFLLNKARGTYFYYLNIPIADFFQHQQPSTSVVIKHGSPTSVGLYKNHGHSAALLDQLWGHTGCRERHTSATCGCSCNLSAVEEKNGTCRIIGTANWLRHRCCASGIRATVEAVYREAHNLEGGIMRGLWRDIRGAVLEGV